MSETLPTGWTRTTIGEVTTEVQQRQPESHKQFSYIDISSIDRETKQIRNPQQLHGENAPSRARKVVAVGDVLVSMTRPNLNAVAIVPSELEGQIASTGFDVLRAIMIEARWLFYLVRSDDFVSAMSNLVQGALYPAVRSKEVRSFEIPLAPLNEQKRIADKLNSLLARVDECRERLERVPVILKRFRQAVLATATSGRLTEDWRISISSLLLISIEDVLKARKQAWNVNEIRKHPPEGTSPEKSLSKKYPEPVDPDNSFHLEKPNNWLLVSADQVTYLITDGKHGDCRNEIESGYFFLSVKDLYGGALHYQDARQIREDDFLEVHYRTDLEVGDVLVTNAGTIGRVAVARDLERSSRTTFQKSVAVLKPVREIVMSEYLAIYIESSVAHLQEKSSGTAVKNLLLRDLRRMMIALPSLAEQREIVRRVETLFAYADRLEARYKTARLCVERLTPALLAKAFRGELVPQDPNDEPASVLLERIRAMRAAESDEPKTKRRKASANRTTRA